MAPNEADLNSFSMNDGDDLTPYMNVLTVDTELPVHSMADLGDKLAANSKKYLSIYDLNKG